ncbi:MAG TPA: PilZ domain-containing protein [Thermoanaerobaculia bacterium]|nr:PilZ domain-containing protein [Thermoanaerobaculia bacterium]
MAIEVKELRSAERYVPDGSLSGSFGSAEVSIMNLSAGGLQILYPLPLRIGSASRVWFRVRDVGVTTQGRILWSHLSKTQDTSGKMQYKSGIKVEDPAYAEVIARLASNDYIKLDGDTMERKKKRLIEKEKERSGKHLLKVVPAEPTISPEQLLLIEHARERLKANPAIAARLYEQARTAEAANGVRTDIVAVWEYLERSIALPTITRVFEHGKG